MLWGVPPDLPYSLVLRVCRNGTYVLIKRSSERGETRPGVVRRGRGNSRTAALGGAFLFAEPANRKDLGNEDRDQDARQGRWTHFWQVPPAHAAVRGSRAYRGARGRRLFRVHRHQRERD